MLSFKRRHDDKVFTYTYWRNGEEGNKYTKFYNKLRQIGQIMFDQTDFVALYQT